MKTVTAPAKPPLHHQMGAVSSHNIDISLRAMVEKSRDHTAEAPSEVCDLRFDFPNLIMNPEKMPNQQARLSEDSDNFIVVVGKQNVEDAVIYIVACWCGVWQTAKIQSASTLPDLISGHSSYYKNSCFSLCLCFS